jgi:hypothetical protein
VCTVALLLAGAASAQVVAETQRVVLSGRPAGGALALFFPWEEPILVDMPSTITALTVAAGGGWGRPSRPVCAPAPHAPAAPLMHIFPTCLKSWGEGGGWWGRAGLPGGAAGLGW